MNYISHTLIRRGVLADTFQVSSDFGEAFCSAKHTCLYRYGMVTAHLSDVGIRFVPLWPHHLNFYYATSPIISRADLPFGVSLFLRSYPFSFPTFRLQVASVLPSTSSTSVWDLSRWFASSLPRHSDRFDCVKSDVIRPNRSTTNPPPNLGEAEAWARGGA